MLPILCPNVKSGLYFDASAVCSPQSAARTILGFYFWACAWNLLRTANVCYGCGCVLQMLLRASDCAEVWTGLNVYPYYRVFLSSLPNISIRAKYFNLLFSAGHEWVHQTWVRPCTFYATWLWPRLKSNMCLKFLIFISIIKQIQYSISDSWSLNE